jgi:hypothetical protein
VAVYSKLLIVPSKVQTGSQQFAVRSALIVVCCFASLAPAGSLVPLHLVSWRVLWVLAGPEVVSLKCAQGLT